MPNIVILGADLTSPAQIQQIASLAAPPPLTACEALNSSDEDDGTSPGCCLVDDHTKAALLTWAKTQNKTIKNIFTFVRSEPADTTHALRSYPVPYFLYGRLCDPLHWVGELGFDRAPAFVGAELRGWEARMWGDYQALVKGEEGIVASGYMYMVESEEVLERIAAFATDQYAVRLCEICCVDEKVVEGCVFAFAGDFERLRSVEEYGMEQRAYEELEAE